MNNFKNSETPAAPTTPVTNNFGQTIMYLGFSKREVIAGNLYLQKFQLGMNKKENEKIMHECYLLADEFLNYEAPENKTDIISLS